MKVNITSGLRALPLLPLLLLSGPYAYAAGQSELHTTSSVPRIAPVDLGTARHFVILTESGITDVPGSAITGNVGVSPITGAADHLTCAEVTGEVYSVDAAGPAPCNIIDPTDLTAAVDDMHTAYTDAAGRAPTTTNLDGGNIGGLTLRPGVYNWTTDVKIASDLKLRGGMKGVWIFQIAGNLNVDNAVKVVVRRSALSRHIFWQVAGEATLGTGSHVEGIVLSKNKVTMGTDASVKGRLYAQTALTLQMNTITAPPTY